MKQSIYYYSITFEASEKPSKRATKIAGMLAKSEPLRELNYLRVWLGSIMTPTTGKEQDWLVQGYAILHRWPRFNTK